MTRPARRGRWSCTWRRRSACTTRSLMRRRPWRWRGRRWVGARTVIGFDVAGREVKFLNKSGKANHIRTWVEFALYDEAKNTINWVPVDVARMRKTTSRPMAIDRTWPYFGTHDELNQVPVIAL